jgi:hypothetical protein
VVPLTSYSLAGNTESSSDRLTLLLAWQAGKRVYEVNGIADLLRDRWTAFILSIFERKINSYQTLGVSTKKKKRLACRAPDQISSSRQPPPFSPAHPSTVEPQTTRHLANHNPLLHRSFALKSLGSPNLASKSILAIFFPAQPILGPLRNSPPLVSPS